MDDKLQKLTQKLYEEGLEKGRNDADELLARAREEAAEIVRGANRQAKEIVEKAGREADELKMNTQTEVALASRQTLSALKQQIGEMIVAREITPAVGQTFRESGFLKELILTVAKNWNPQSGGADLSVLIPEDSEAELEKELKASVGKELGTGGEIVRSGNVKSGFRIGPKDGGYYISFSDADFNALIGEYLRPKVAQLLFGEN